MIAPGPDLEDLKGFESAFKFESIPEIEVPTNNGQANKAPSLSPGLKLARVTLLSVFIFSLSLVLELTVVSSVQQRSVQQRLFEQFRKDLAIGTAPVGTTDSEGMPLKAGSPVAYIEIPSIGLSQVVVEGTSSENLLNGPGHRRDSPLPGQEGVSVLMGRRATFGGPFSEIHKLHPGALIKLTTGQGEFSYKVSGVRQEGDLAPGPLDSGSARLLLATAGGMPFLPSGVVRVDADLSGSALGATSPIYDNSTLPKAEQMMAGDSGTLWALALWMQCLLLLVLAAIWAWYKLGRARAWVLFLPPLLLVGLNAAGETARLLPNLL